jgi:hypothetical protein
LLSITIEIHKMERRAQPTCSIFEQYELWTEPKLSLLCSNSWKFQPLDMQLKSSPKMTSQQIYFLWRCFLYQRIYFAPPKRLVAVFRSSACLVSFPCTWPSWSVINSAKRPASLRYNYRQSCRQVEHCKDTIPKIWKQIFPEKELRGLSPNFHIHVSVSELYIPMIGLPILLQEHMCTDPGNI